MTLRVSTLFGFFALFFSFVTASHWSRRHQEVAHRARGDVAIHKRQSFTGARFTFYAVGLGACGHTNVATDFIVALNVEQYGNGYPGPYCFQWITIQYGGLTAQAQIMDECMGCPYGGLDFSEGLFSYFADTSEGVIYGNWWFNSGSGGGGGQSSTSASPTWVAPTTTSTADYTPPPSTSSTPDYTPPATSSTPAYTPPTTSTTSTTFSTSSTSSSYSTSSSSSSINSSTGTVTGLAVPTGGVVSIPDTSNPENLLVINDIVVEIGFLLSAAN